MSQPTWWLGGLSPNTPPPCSAQHTLHSQRRSKDSELTCVVLYGRMSPHAQNRAQQMVQVNECSARWHATCFRAAKAATEGLSPKTPTPCSAGSPHNKRQVNRQLELTCDVLYGRRGDTCGGRWAVNRKHLRTATHQGNAAAQRDHNTS
jgi:hypothetical protein